MKTEHDVKHEKNFHWIHSCRYCNTFALRNTCECNLKSVVVGKCWQEIKPPSSGGETQLGSI